ncbi:hypothetical protein QMA10_05465 [Arthrobacter sp. APC 3897]|uniref:hypothetical protein n=1 Tax=Arthrobacter sp. APC 3897 TaxID=3035204 RepID=UPI0025B53F1A|nr:hypothetical protein [Arthrobacter sp. APC 3897]MDN3481370.1 hypothetical protein [Arthrobacter sp. APC 3897]
MILQWIAFIVSVFFALLRLPGAVRGQNRGMFFALILLAASMGLSIPAIYLPVDSILGGVNVANLFIRYCLFAVLLILGVKTAAAFGAPRTHRMIAGPAGLAVLGTASAAVAVLFILSDLPESSTALAAYWDQDTVTAYGDISRLYQVYVVSCLIPPLFLCTADSARRPDIRLSAGLLALGLSVVFVHSLLILSVWNLQLVFWDRILPNFAVIVISMGLALIWNSRRVAKTRSPQGPLAKVYGSR